MSQTSQPTKIKPSKSEIMTRSNARVLAVQAAYALDIMGSQNFANIVSSVLQNQSIFLKSLGRAKSTEVDEKLYFHIVKGITHNQIAIDAQLTPHLASDWRVERLGAVVRAILRAAAYELMYSKKFDVALIINEYLDIAKIMSHGGEVGFINKVLDSMVGPQL